MLRVHFTPEDIARVRVAAAPDPLWEITNSFQLLARKDTSLVFGEWRRLVRQQLPSCGPVLGSVLGPLLPPRGYSPDFLTPDLCGSHDLDSAVDTLLSTPRACLRRDLLRLAASSGRYRPLPSGTRALAEGAPEALRRLGAALRAYHQHALVPFWPHIRAEVDADRAERARAVLSGGVEGLLASLRPVLRWEPPVLEADYPVHRELRLRGRGLLLQPSFFCSRTPVTLVAEEPAAVLVYPIQHTLGWAGDHSGGTAERVAALGALIGRTRAAILEDVVAGRTTGELAGRFGISGPAASQHTAVLRRAGLLRSVRRSRSVLHTITPAGLALLDSPLHTPLQT
ncbi:winged helix-turn-helix domain-containing protein [Streptomyces deserti]